MQRIVGRLEQNTRNAGLPLDRCPIGTNFLGKLYAVVNSRGSPCIGRGPTTQCDHRASWQ
ncbi:hypothetical protein Q31a_51740 [Aureliella helgolandensis]|uniref:Uncharacterized protein n=1 Tax=Aureliella helgolandensis TaxID=2527968 RepID=A0A518GDW4_9BACT|nr:hypothetical protein Q31a_51740 [Aureliella helgolandensis]